MDIWAILSRIAESIARLFEEAAALLSAMSAPQQIALACVGAAVMLLLVAFVKPRRDPAPSLLASAAPRGKKKRSRTVPQAYDEREEAAVRPAEFSYRAQEEELLLPVSHAVAPVREPARLQPSSTLNVFGRDYRVPDYDEPELRKPPRVKRRKPPLRPWRTEQPTQALAPVHQSYEPSPFQEWEPLEPQHHAYERQLPAQVLSTRDILARLEARRGSRVIAIIHRENMARDRLDAVDLEDALTAIRKTPKDRPLDVIIHSPGGWISCAQQIARAIKAHPAKTTVFVPYFALGSTSFMAFAADEVVMSQHAALSPVDPFVAYGSASSVLAGIKNKPIDRVSDTTVIYADFARKLLDETRRVTCELMHDGKEHCGACRLADELVSGKSYSWRAISPVAAKELGMHVSIAMPSEVYDLIRSCRRDNDQAASVAYLDYERGPARAQQAALPPPERQRVDLAGAIDSSVVYIDRSHAPKKRRPVRHENLVWLAQSGGHVPEAALDRAKTIIRRIEHERGSRVICVIHGENMENEAFDFDDLEDVLSAIVTSDTSRPLDIVLHTQGGNSFTGRQIARAIKSHQARKTVFVPYFAMSAGSRIALAADQIVMGAHAMLGPIDTQLYAGPAPSIVQLSKVKPFESISDEYLILAEEARKIIQEGRATARELLQGSYTADGSTAIADELISGKWTHGFPITAQAAYNMGLNVATGMPELFYDLVRCFRHADGEEPSVLFLPR
ncbi:MAG: SDH family Clp fold serine proteinase [Micropepsaceae bacterium]